MNERPVVRDRIGRFVSETLKPRAYPTFLEEYYARMKEDMERREQYEKQLEANKLAEQTEECWGTCNCKKE